MHVVDRVIVYILWICFEAKETLYKILYKQSSTGPQERAANAKLQFKLLLLKFHVKEKQYS